MLLLYDYDVVLQPLFKVQAQQQSIASLTTAQYNDLLTYFNEREMKVSILCQPSLYFLYWCPMLIKGDLTYQFSIKWIYEISFLKHDFTNKHSGYSSDI